MCESETGNNKIKNQKKWIIFKKKLNSSLLKKLFDIFIWKLKIFNRMMHNNIRPNSSWVTVQVLVDFDNQYIVWKFHHFLWI